MTTQNKYVELAEVLEISDTDKAILLDEKIKTNTCKKIFNYITLYLLAFLIFPLIDIIIGSTVISCDKVVLSLSQAIIIKGILSLCTAIILLIHLKKITIDTIYVVKFIVRIFFYILFFVEFCWLIITTASFFLGCNKIHPPNMKHFVWVSLLYCICTLYAKFELYRRSKYIIK